MWFVFPQLRGLGRSSMATFYGIGSLHEARAYLAHPLLGPRLESCTRTVFDLENGSLQQIFGSPDDVKPIFDDFVRSRGRQPCQRVLQGPRPVVRPRSGLANPEAFGGGRPAVICPAVPRYLSLN